MYLRPNLNVASIPGGGSFAPRPSQRSNTRRCGLARLAAAQAVGGVGPRNGCGRFGQDYICGPHPERI